MSAEDRLDSATSQTEPAFMVFGSISFSFTNFPSFVNTCRRSPCRSQTYTRSSLAMTTQWTGLRNCCCGGAFGSCAAPLIGRLRGVLPAAVRVQRAKNGSIVRFVAVRAPHAFELAGIGIQHDHAVIDVSVGHIGFVGLRHRRRSSSAARSSPCPGCWHR